MKKEKAFVIEAVWDWKHNKLFDYIELTKFRLLLLVLITVGIGYYLSPQGKNVWVFLHVLLGVAGVGAGANALNQWYEHASDAQMNRTKHRPIPCGKLSPNEALGFGLIVSILGLIYLMLTVNFLTATLGFISWATYLFIYTPLKQHTMLNTWVGAVPGALPPVMGWTAAQGTLNAEAVSLFAILYLWQLPHFFAIAWVYREDYKNGGFRMLSLEDPTGQKTSYQMLINTVLLLLASLSLFFTKQTGNLYLLSALGLGLFFLASTLLFFKQRTVANAKRVFFASIIYFPILWVVMVLDRMLG